VAFVFVRAAAYATFFIGFLLVFLPRRILAASGIVRPAALGPWEVVSIILGAAGALLALWCILTFVSVGKGTPAPFDPPRRLVASGPYRYLRNPMYLGAALALGGAALFYRSLALLIYVVLFLAVTHVFVVLYEEPTLARLFGADYAAYRERVHRWVPRIGRPHSSTT
jgi:protein-S-isoprenylcysteine O-methyltransferase Ste14